MEKVKPYKDKASSKKTQIAEMFDNISHNYDFLNHFLSAGIDTQWRKVAIKLLEKEKPKIILDVATGTADFALEAIRLDPTRIVGIDISQGMLDKGIEKVKQKGLEDKIELQLGDSENIDFPGNYFDAAIVSFGVRNFENLEKGLKNIYEVLKPKGTLIVLEFSKPTNFPFKQLYNFYFKNILPNIGKTISKDASAYTYLPESVKAFPDGHDFIDILLEVGFREILFKKLTFGICTIYRGRKIV